MDVTNLTKLAQELLQADPPNIPQLYQDGLSLRQICAQTGLSYAEARGALLRAGVVLRPRNWLGKARGKGSYKSRRRTD